MNLKQYQEDTLKKFEDLPNTEMTTREFIISSLKGQLEVVVKMVGREKCVVPKDPLPRNLQDLETLTLDKIDKCLEYAGRINYNRALEDISTPLLEEIKNITK